jgi:hypothetical protein
MADGAFSWATLKMDGPRASTRNRSDTASIPAYADYGVHPSEFPDDCAGAHLLQEDEGQLR